jgi:hypothetical protein
VRIFSCITYFFFALLLISLICCYLNAKFAKRTTCCSLSDPRRALVNGRLLRILFLLSFCYRECFLFKRYFKIELKKLLVFCCLEIKFVNVFLIALTFCVQCYTYCVLIIIFNEAPVLWRPHWLFFANIFRRLR